MPVRLCLERYCAEPAVMRGRCDAHAAAKERGRRFKRFYHSPAWEMTRRRQLFDYPLCDVCGRIATTVHHRVPLSVGGAPRSPSNLQSLCAGCHTRLHKPGVTM